MNTRSLKTATLYRIRRSTYYGAYPMEANVWCDIKICLVNSPILNTTRFAHEILFQHSSCGCTINFNTKNLNMTISYATHKGFKSCIIFFCALTRIPHNNFLGWKSFISAYHLEHHNPGTGGSLLETIHSQAVVKEHSTDRTNPLSRTAF